MLDPASTWLTRRGEEGYAKREVLSFPQGAVERRWSLFSESTMRTIYEVKPGRYFRDDTVRKGFSESRTAFTAPPSRDCEIFVMYQVIRAFLSIWMMLRQGPKPELIAAGNTISCLKALSPYSEMKVAMSGLWIAT